MAEPNFILILTETQGANVVGTYGSPDLRTPNIDRLATQGVKFQNAYTTSPVCSPARAGLFTGIYPHNSGPWSNNMPLGANVKTMGQRFRDHGYQTVYIGKWHLDGHDYFGDGLCPDGWDEHFWYDGKRYLEDLSDHQVSLWREKLKTPEDIRKHQITPEFTWGHRIVDRAISFLQEFHEQPFLLVVSFDEPHDPYTCPYEFIEPFLDYQHPLGPAAFDDLQSKPAHHREWAANLDLPVGKETYSNPMYFGCNSFVDFEVGRLLEAADRLAPDATYTIYTADHGDMFHAHGLFSKGPVMYQEIVRIPLIIRQPKGFRSGTSDTSPISHIDLLPTMLELAEIEIPPILDGESLVNHLQGDHQHLDRQVMVEFLRHTLAHDSYGGFQPIRCLVNQRFKLVINLLHTDELYDLSQDPGEVINLIDNPEYAAIRDQMHDALLDRMNGIRDPFRGPCWERRPWRSTTCLGWTGKYRAKPDDGYSPPALLYKTGRPAKEAKETDLWTAVTKDT